LYTIFLFISFISICKDKSLFFVYFFVPKDALKNQTINQLNEDLETYKMQVRAFSVLFITLTLQLLWTECIRPKAMFSICMSCPLFFKAW